MNQTWLSAGKTWRKEDELKGLKSELAALDRKIQLELAPPTKVNGQEQTEDTQQDDRKEEHFSETVKSDVNDDYVRNHTLIVRPGISDESKVQSKAKTILFMRLFCTLMESFLYGV